MPWLSRPIQPVSGLRDVTLINHDSHLGVTSFPYSPYLLPVPFFPFLVHPQPGISALSAVCKNHKKTKTPWRLPPTCPAFGPCHNPNLSVPEPLPPSRFIPPSAILYLISHRRRHFESVRHLSSHPLAPPHPTSPLTAFSDHASCEHLQRDSPTAASPGCPSPLQPRRRQSSWGFKFHNKCTA